MLIQSIRPMTGKRSSSGDATDESAASPNKILRTDKTADTGEMETAAVASEVAEPRGATPAKIQLRDEIQLTDKEMKLFEFLLDVEKQYDCKAVLRVAGGWVRDKVCG
jgi:hypothetical protein